MKGLVFDDGISDTMISQRRDFEIKGLKTTLSVCLPGLTTKQKTKLIVENK